MIYRTKRRRLRTSWNTTTKLSATASVACQTALKRNLCDRYTCTTNDSSNIFRGLNLEALKHQLEFPASLRRNEPLAKEVMSYNNWNNLSKREVLLQVSSCRMCLLRAEQAAVLAACSTWEDKLVTRTQTASSHLKNSRRTKWPPWWVKVHQTKH